MGKLTAFQIDFTNSPTAVYFAGQLITGKLTVGLNEGMKMRNIRLDFVGQAYTHWSETHSHTTGSGSNRRTHSETRNYSAMESYFQLQCVVWGNQPGMSGDSQILAPGNYEFPFQFVLPPNCPTSFEGTYGYIRYWIKATIDKPWKFDHTAKRVFTVVGIQDLNLDPLAAQPVSNQKGKELGCACCPAGTLSTQIGLPKKGFVPGELLPISIVVNNESTRKLKHVRLELRQNVIFKAQHLGGWHTRNTPRSVLSITKDLEALPAGESYKWPSEAVIIPPVPPMQLNCGIIDINYTLHVEVTPHGMSFDLDSYMPITIGTIPLRSAFFPAPPPAQESRPTYVPQQLPAPEPGGPMPSAPPQQALYPDLPPPSYEESVFGAGNIRDEHDTQYTQGPADFAPRYPTYYDWSKSGFSNPGTIS